MCNTVVCFHGCDAMNFKVSLIFLIKPFFYMTKKSRQKSNYLENKQSFYSEIKNIFHHFQSALEPYINKVCTFSIIFEHSLSPFSTPVHNWLATVTLSLQTQTLNMIRNFFNKNPILNIKLHHLPPI